jgi:hypothetical protein
VVFASVRGSDRGRLVSTAKPCSVCGQTPGARGAHRRFEMTISVTSDSEEGLLERFREVVTQVQTRRVSEVDMLSAGPSSSAWVKVTERPDQTHEKWERELEEHIQRLEAEARAGEPVSPEVNR